MALPLLVTGLAAAHVNTWALGASVHGLRAPSRLRSGARMLEMNTAQQPAEVDISERARDELDAFTPGLALPDLSEEDETRLAEGERLEFVVMPRNTTGSGISVQDVQAHPADVFAAVSDFPRYQTAIKTVREVDVYEASGPNTKARVDVSRFKLKLFVNFTTYPADNLVSWTLDRDAVTRFIRDCVGYWHVEPIPGRNGWSRVWFVVRVRLSPFVPRIIESLVARVGLRRATTWIQNLSAAPEDDKPVDDVIIDRIEVTD